MVSRTLASTLLLALLPGLGCGVEPAEPATPAAIEALPDPVARLRALERAVYSGAWTLDELDAACDTFADGELAEACRRYLGRPHLFRGAALEGREDARSRGACPSSCEQGPSRLDCVVDASVSADASCDCLDQPLARDECWFRLAQARGADGGLPACLAAGKLKGPCLHHHAEALGGECPPLDSEGLEGWAALSSRVGELEAAVGHWDDFERRQLTDVVWAGAMRCAFQHPVDFDPGLIASVPPGALPHLRAALAWHTVAGLGDPAPTLDEAAALLAAYETSGRLQATPESPVQLPAGPGDGWAWDNAAYCQRLAGGCAFPAVRYFAMGKRLLGERAEDERRICLLEAAARLRPCDWDEVVGLSPVVGADALGLGSFLGEPLVCRQAPASDDAEVVSPPP